ncbi:hypothetical protein [Streptomyces sp. NPDC094468]
MKPTISEAPVTPQLPVLVSDDADQVTLGRQTFNDSDKSNYFE